MKRFSLFFSLLILLVGESMGQCTPVDCSAILPPYGGVCDTILMEGNLNMPFSDFESFVITDQCFDAGLIDPTQAGTSVRITNVDNFSFSLLPMGLTGVTNAASYSTGGGTVVGCASVDGTPTEAGIFEFSIDFLADIELCGFFPIPVNDNAANYLVDLTILPDASFSGLGGTYCSDDADVTLMMTGSTGGVFSGAGVTGTTFSPVAAGPGTHIITYTVSAQEGAAVAPATNSSTMTVIVEDCTLPCDAPINPDFAVLSSTSVQLSWDAAGTGAAVDFYKVRYRVFGTSTWIYTNATATTKSLTGLASGEFYEFRVQANCGGVLSVPTAFKRWEQTICQSPLYSSIVGTPVCGAQRQVMLTWDAPANATVERYKILYRAENSTAPAGQWEAKYTPDASTSKLLTGLEVNTTYKVRVKTWCPGEKSYIYNGNATFTTAAVACRMGLNTEGISLFPNPASNVLNVSYEITDEEAAVSFTITDITGRTISTTNSDIAFGQQQETLDISQLGGGYYFLTISANGENVTKKFAVVK